MAVSDQQSKTASQRADGPDTQGGTTSKGAGLRGDFSTGAAGGKGNIAAWVAQISAPRAAIPRAGYESLEIEISPCCHCGQREIRVLSSPRDRPRQVFQPAPEELERLRQQVEVYDTILHDTQVDPSRREELALSIGCDLYRLLFRDDVGDTFEACIAGLEEALLHRSTGLRLRLSFGGPRSYDHELGSLPWELLANPESRRFLANGTTTPIVRYLDLDRRIAPLPVEPPLKVLIVTPSPVGQRPVNVEWHRKVLKTAIGAKKWLQAKVLEPPTLAALDAKLARHENAGKPFHVVHFLGHGGFNGDGEGALFFQGDDGREQVVTGRQLADRLPRGIRLVVLASCQTGAIDRKGGESPFTGVGSALVAAGVPAVVAMQFNVTERAVAHFASVFYSSVGDDEAVDVAVTRGRLGITNDNTRSTEWATPVLFLRSPKSHILKLQPAATVPRKNICIYNTHDYGKDELEIADYDIDLRDSFEGRFLKEGVTWNGDVLGKLSADVGSRLPQDSPYNVIMAAPLSVAFAAGFLLPVHAGRDLHFSQRGPRGRSDWRFDESVPADAPGWQSWEVSRKAVPETFPLDPEADDVAVVVSAARPAIPAVQNYWLESNTDRRSVREVIHACFDEGAGHQTIKNGAHANELAQALINRIDEVTTGSSQRGTVHLFLSCPNVLAFVLGRLAHVCRRVQLYEYDKSGQRDGTYTPSITLVPPDYS